MAWNEPGNNGNDKDPWNNKGGRDQGPPDLDEVFRKFSNKFGGLFGGKKSGNGSGGGLGGAGISFILIIAAIVWALSGIYTVKEAERGVVLQFGKYDRIAEPGLRWKMTFIETVIPVDIEAVRSLSASGFMLTEDENVVSVEFQVQYRVIDPYLYKFSVTNADSSLEEALDSALRYVVGHAKMDQVLTNGREEVRQNTWDELNKVIEPYNLGLIVTDVNFKDSRPPTEVKDAFDDAIAAQEDEERFIREAEAYAREIEPRARGQVTRMTQEAEGYQERITLEAQGEVARFEKLLPEYLAAKEVTRERLYIDAMEEVLGSSSKVLVDVKGGNNMMYLPLDKIMEKQGTATRVALPSSSDIQDLRNKVNTSRNSTVNSSNDRFNNDRFN
ncbi:protease modulator HflK [Pseudoalteromonas sp. 13-15]|jgi:membrane protease subunit HflK|uniref:FtsH protease activity modulator HflK n=1 Tax=Pseudoalteromonas TaxID=53246 RepID=UPI0000EA8F7B|nr:MULTISPECIES: FtsH protease activity modulator HflK [Pseudoalteromonas]EAW29409.1 HflK complex with HflC [Alteromonadales bacterium TW-7]MBL1384393.1 FtsH protease activity modulator HflK [Colwellia sp.]AUL73908.1 protease modulator HflK [Pseudoalteromonas sp. 13-15]MCK8121884.1 FtsH protease activity modulator HflK [Pseudoalteromonas sp. 2CM32C]MDP2487588.1 FtsH protease activity modulator HflK [Pseudoalteromonas marina]|tara:strand:- start:26039 stop:27199 length:1161 start_codon:yes stop_codon:yes gene_type:complete